MYEAAKSRSEVACLQLQITAPAATVLSITLRNWPTSWFAYCQRTDVGMQEARLVGLTLPAKVRQDAAKRLQATECLRHRWFDPLHQKAHAGSQILLVALVLCLTLGYIPMLWPAVLCLELQFFPAAPFAFARIVFQTCSSLLSAGIIESLAHQMATRPVRRAQSVQQLPAISSQPVDQMRAPGTSTSMQIAELDVVCG